MTQSRSSAATAHTRATAPAPNPLTKQVTVQDVVFESSALSRTSKYRVLLPPGYSESSYRYPLLVLLHGVFGSSENWETLTHLSRYANAADLIIAMPDAGNSWYVNSAAKPQDRFEDFLLQDLLPDVESRWRILRSSHRRAIAGLSMGGYGALKYAIKYPDTFAVAASISGAFSGPLDLETDRPDLADDLNAAFGAAGSTTRRENDLFQLLAKANTKQLPYFYLDCGIGDEFCNVNRKLAATLRTIGARYEYHELPGEHSWEYWDRRISVALPMIDKMLRPAE